MTTTIINQQSLTGIDKLGDTYTVWYNNSIKDVPELYSTVLRQYADLIDSGHAPLGSAAPFANNPTIYIKYGNVIAASITYRIDTDLAWILFTNVNDQYQGRGLYTKLHKSFEYSAQRSGCVRAGSLLHVDNARIRKISEINGYTTEFVRMTKKFS